MGSHSPFLFLASGSAATNVDSGFIVQSGSGKDTGQTIFWDTSTGRWTVLGKYEDAVGHSATTISGVGIRWIATVNNPNTVAQTDTEFGVGSIQIDKTSVNDIWIRVS